MDAAVKQEVVETVELPEENRSSAVPKPVVVIDLSSSDSDSDSSDDSDVDESPDMQGKRPRASNGVNGGSFKKRKLKDFGVVLPVGFLDPLPPEEPLPAPVRKSQLKAVLQSCKQFWKAGDYDRSPVNESVSSLGGMDHVRVHPKFLHSNATSHKWALGAFAELLDNSLDETCHGATYVKIDMLDNKKDGSRMLLIEDNGGGMDPDKMRQCISLGYSAKSKLANTIGQYGNGFKTSTMRLGADVIVFSRCCGKDGRSPTQSIGMLSYTFLRATGKEDIVVPMLDYERGGWDWNKMLRSSPGDWSRNVETIVHWSPYSSEADLLQQFNLMKDQGTRIVIYNLWEDDQGELELDFDTDRHDIQIRGVNRDEKKIQMAQQFPNSRHFLTYRHSLRSYASILYLRLPPGFRIVLRGKDVAHHNIVHDMMLKQEVTYRPQPGADGVPKDPNMVAVVTIGFVKDAKHHIDVQGFNVYHKNRLIKPFWRVWNAAGSDGRGVIGVLEANFVEPAHDKQGFERTTVLSRLESRLVVMQKQYWSTNCHRVGYAPRCQRKLVNEPADRELSPEFLLHSSSRSSKKSTSPSRVTSLPDMDKCNSRSNQKQVGRRDPEKSSKVGEPHGNGHVYSKGGNRTKTSSKFGKRFSPEPTPAEDDDDHEMPSVSPEKQVNGSVYKASVAQKSFRTNGSQMIQSSPYSENNETEQDYESNERTNRIATPSQSKVADVTCNNENTRASFDSEAHRISQLEKENRDLKERLKKLVGESLPHDLLHDLQAEKDRCKALEVKLQVAEQKIEEMNKEQEALIDIFQEERIRRDSEEGNLRNKLKEASNTIQELLDKARLTNRNGRG